MKEPSKWEPTSDMAIPPGEYLKEVMEAQHLSIGDMQRAGIYPHHLEAILAGDVAITEQVAEQLERATRVARNIWLGLELEYQRAKRGDDGKK